MEILEKIMELKNKVRKGAAAHSFSDRIIYYKVWIVIAAVVFSAAAITVGSYAWYYRNSNVSQSAGNSTSDNVSVSVEGFQIMGYVDNGITGDERNERYVFYSEEYNDPEPDASGNTPKIIMVPYDTIGNHNEHTPLVIKIPVRGQAVMNGDALKVTLSINESSDWIGDNLMMKAILSNIVEVKCGVINHDGTDLEIWNAVTGAAENSSGATYVAWGDDNPVKTDVLSFTVSGYTPPVSGKALNLYLIIDYNELLVQKYMIKNKLTIRLGTNETETKFYNDFLKLDVNIA
ncbi:MAG: hypothetical protein PUB32_00950 [Clostridiales bacterium]|nr:hypothetical protein [Clostridiales bacterium]